MGSPATLASGQYVIKKIFNDNFIGTLNLGSAPTNSTPPNTVSAFVDSSQVAQVWLFEQQSDIGSYTLTNWGCFTGVSNGNVAAIPGSQSGEKWNITQYLNPAHNGYLYMIQTNDYSAGWLLDHSLSKRGIFPVTCNKPLKMDPDMSIPGPDQGFWIEPYTG